MRFYICLACAIGSVWRFSRFGLLPVRWQVAFCLPQNRQDVRPRLGIQVSVVLGLSLLTQNLPKLAIDGLLQWRLRSTAEQVGFCLLEDLQDVASQLGCQMSELGGLVAAF